MHKKARKYFILFITVCFNVLLLNGCGNEAERNEAVSTVAETEISEQHLVESFTEDEEPVSIEDAVIAEVSPEDVLKGNPISYDCLKIDGWIFEWLVSDYVDADRYFWEDGVLIITKEGSAEEPQIIHVEGEAADGDLAIIENKFVYMDVNFDETPDLLISTGGHGAQGAISYYCFLRMDDGFEEVPSFVDIANPSVDVENNLVLSQWRNAAVSHSWAEYEYQNGTYVMVRELKEEMIIPEGDSENGDEIFCWTINDEIVAQSGEQTIDEIDELLYGEGGGWQIYDGRWKTISNNGLMADYSIYLEPEE